MVLGWDGELPQPELHGSTATYKDVRPGLDLVVVLSAVGFEQFYVLTQAPADPGFVLDLPLATTELSAVERADGTIKFLDDQQKAVATITSPFMWDARVDPASGLPAALTPLDMSVTEPSNASDVGSLTLEPDPDFFSNPRIEYPVTIDPSVVLSTSGDTFVRSDFPTTTYQSYTPTELQVGTYNSGTTKARSFLNFSTTGWKGAQVTAASLKLWEFHSYSCGASTMTVYPSNTVSGSTNWNNQPTLLTTTTSSSASFAKGYSSSCADGWATINVLSVFSYLAGRDVSTAAISLRASETSNSGWKRFNSNDATSNKPSLTITYNRYPATATTPTAAPSQSQGAAFVTSSAFPAFASSSTDADGGTTKLSIEVHNVATGMSASTLVGSCLTPFVTQGSAGSCTLSTPLVTGATYYVRARGFDGSLYSASWSPTVTLVADIPVGTPSTPILSSPQPWTEIEGGELATSRQPTLIASSHDPNNDPVSVEFQVYADAQMSAGSLVASCTDIAQPNDEAAECALQTRLSEAAYFVRARATDGTWTSSWSALTPLTFSSRVTAQELAEDVFGSADPESELAALSTEDNQLLIDFGILADPTAAPTAQDLAAESAAAGQLVDVSLSDLVFASESYVEGSQDNGAAAEVAEIKAVLPGLLEADTDVGQLDAAALATPSVVLSSEAEEQRLGQLEQVWSDDTVSEQASLWNDGLELALSDDQYVPFDNNAFVLTAWRGVEVSGETAIAAVDGYETYQLIDGTTFEDVPTQYQVTLKLTADGWRLSKKVLVPVPETGDASLNVAAMATASNPGYFLRTNAVAYARAYSCNITFNRVPGQCANKAFGYVATGDCTNFVSQALRYAGMDQVGGASSSDSDLSKWYWVDQNKVSKTWGWVADFKTFMVTSSQRATLKQITNLSADYSGVQAGDVYLVDLHGAGISHAMISVGPGKFADYYDPALKHSYREWGAYGSRIAQHSSDRVDAPWNWGYLTAPNAKTKAVIKYYVLHFTAAG